MPEPSAFEVQMAIEKLKKTHVARMREGRGAYRILVGKPERQRPLGRPRHRWEGTIKMDIQEVRTWIGFIWLRIGTGGGLL